MFLLPLFTFSSLFSSFSCVAVPLINHSDPVILISINIANVETIDHKTNLPEQINHCNERPSAHVHTGTFAMLRGILLVNNLSNY